MTHEVQDEFKSRFTCPKCGAKIRIESGNCPKCGFIGQMQHKDIRLRATTTAGKEQTVPSPTQHQAADTQNSPIASRQYTCPHCGTSVSRRYGRCPNRQGCGYVGTMQSKENHQ